MKPCVVFLFQCLATDPGYMRRELMAIAFDNPEWSRGKISSEFARRFPNERNPPSGDKVARLLSHSTIEGDRKVTDWRSLPKEVKRKISWLAWNVMKTTLATADPEASRMEVVKQAYEDFHSLSGGVNIGASRMMRLYTKIRTRNGKKLGRREKESRILEIVDCHCEWTHPQVAAEFNRLNPNESISTSSVSQYVKYRNLCGFTDRRNNDWLKLSREQKKLASAAAVEIMQKLVAESPREDWRVIVSRGVVEMQDKFGMRIQPTTMYKHYRTVKSSV